eukprot:COSAG02_NODE_2351_length_9081_cov_101.624137_6_plen_116_part_00
MCSKHVRDMISLLDNTVSDLDANVRTEVRGFESTAPTFDAAPECASNVRQHEPNPYRASTNLHSPSCSSHVLIAYYPAMHRPPARYTLSIESHARARARERERERERETERDRES